jgi:hypothetical protein
VTRFFFNVDVLGSCNLRGPSCPVGNTKDVEPPTGFMDPPLLAAIITKAKSECEVAGVGLFHWTEPIQFAKGDQTVPNPTASAIFRAGDLTDRSTFFRNDLAFAAFPSIPKNPHTFLTNIAIPAAAPLALGAQAQIAIFFESDGTVVIDPDGALPIFEVPIAGPLPEALNFLP